MEAEAGGERALPSAGLQGGNRLREFVSELPRYILRYDVAHLGVDRKRIAKVRDGRPDRQRCERGPCIAVGVPARLRIEEDLNERNPRGRAEALPVRFIGGAQVLVRRRREA